MPVKGGLIRVGDQELADGAKLSLTQSRKDAKNANKALRLRPLDATLKRFYREGDRRLLRIVRARLSAG